MEPEAYGRYLAERLEVITTYSAGDLRDVCLGLLHEIAALHERLRSVERSLDQPQEQE